MIARISSIDGNVNNYLHKTPLYIQSKAIQHAAQSYNLVNAVVISESSGYYCLVNESSVNLEITSDG